MDEEAQIEVGDNVMFSIKTVDIECLHCGRVFHGAAQVELCAICVETILSEPFDPKTFERLYEKLDQRESKRSNTHTDATLSNFFPAWLADNLDRRAKLLEVGCGGGYLAEAIRQEGFESVIASDFNKEAVATAAKRFPNLRVEVCNAVALPFESNCFDAVIAVEVVEHLFHPETHFAEVCRILKLGGKYLIRTPNWLASKIYYWLSERYDMKVWHPSIYSSLSLVKQLREIGFAVEHLSPRTLPDSQREKLPRPFRAVAPLLCFLPPFLRPGITCVATKLR